MEGFFPREIVAFNVPVESCLGTTGDLDPRGEDFGEYCSPFLNWSAMSAMTLNVDWLVSISMYHP